MDAPLLFAAALTEVFNRLNWSLLGQHYCFEGGEHFFDETQRSSLFEAQIGFASEVGETLAKVEPDGPRRSLYVGVALSELGPMLGEQLLLEREVLAYSLKNPETVEINRCLSEVASELDHALPQIRTGSLAKANLPNYDHLWMVSVLNDPEAFPALHDRLYDREGTDLAMQTGNLAEETALASALCLAAFRGLTRPGFLTTSDEEQPLIQKTIAELGLKMTKLGDSILSPVVEDPVSFWRIRRADK